VIAGTGTAATRATSPGACGSFARPGDSTGDRLKARRTTAMLSASGDGVDAWGISLPKVQRLGHGWSRPRRRHPMNLDPNRLTLKLRALDGGAYTQLRLTGPVVTMPDRRQLRRLLSVLALWHGAPVDVVLCVDGSAGWLEIWDDALQGVPARQASIRFLINRGTLLGQDDEA
jgi:hypothetical protein